MDPSQRRGHVEKNRPGDFRNCVKGIIGRIDRFHDLAVDHKKARVRHACFVYTDDDGHIHYYGSDVFIDAYNTDAVEQLVTEHRTWRNTDTSYAPCKKSTTDIGRLLPAHDDEEGFVFSTMNAVMVEDFLRRILRTIIGAEPMYETEKRDATKTNRPECWPQEIPFVNPRDKRRFGMDSSLPKSKILRGIIRHIYGFYGIEERLGETVERNSQGSPQGSPTGDDDGEEGDEGEGEAAAVVEERRRREAAAVAAEDQRRRTEAAVAAEDQRRRTEAAVAAEDQRRRTEAAVAAEDQRRRTEAAVAAEDQRRRTEAAVAAEDQRRRREAAAAAAAASAEDQRRRREAAVAAEDQRRRREAAAAAAAASAEEQRRRREAAVAAEDQRRRREAAAAAAAASAEDQRRRREAAVAAEDQRRRREAAAAAAAASAEEQRRRTEAAPVADSRSDPIPTRTANSPTDSIPTAIPTPTANVSQGDSSMDDYGTTCRAFRSTNNLVDYSSSDDEESDDGNVNLRSSSRTPSPPPPQSQSATDQRPSPPPSQSATEQRRRPNILPIRIKGKIVEIEPYIPLHVLVNELRKTADEEEQRFQMHVNAIKDQISTMTDALNSASIGRDLRSLPVLQQEHEELERALDSLYGKVHQLNELRGSNVNVQQLNDELVALTVKVKSRKAKLDAYDYGRFLSTSTTSPLIDEEVSARPISSPFTFTEEDRENTRPTPKRPQRRQSDVEAAAAEEQRQQMEAAKEAEQAAAAEEQRQQMEAAKEAEQAAAAEEQRQQMEAAKEAEQAAAAEEQRQQMEAANEDEQRHHADSENNRRKQKRHNFRSQNTKSNHADTQNKRLRSEKLIDIGNRGDQVPNGEAVVRRNRPNELGDEEIVRFLDIARSSSKRVRGLLSPAILACRNEGARAMQATEQPSDKNRKIVQIHFVSPANKSSTTATIGHWVASAYYGYGPVCLYDSLAGQTARLRTRKDLRQQLIEVYGHLRKNGNLKVRVFSLPSQSGGMDCGRFAIAYATDILLNNRPEERKYAQNSLEEHLRKIEAEGLSQFPGIVCTAAASDDVTLGSTTCCYFPDPTDNIVHWTGCENDSCGAWFHTDCLVRDGMTAPFTCPICKTSD